MVYVGDDLKVEDTLIDLLEATLSANVNASTTAAGVGLTKSSGNIDLASSGYGFIAPRDGLYALSWTQKTPRNSTYEVYVQARVNAGGSSTGGTGVALHYVSPSGGTAGVLSFKMYEEVPLNAGDTLELWIVATGSLSNALQTSTSGASRLTVSRRPGTLLLS
jgi:hypothetical protein